MVLNIIANASTTIASGMQLLHHNLDLANSKKKNQQVLQI